MELSREIRQKLEDDRKNHIPRYLFRAFCDQSGRGEPGFNNTLGVTPHAFLYGVGHESPYDMSKTELVGMVHAHVYGLASPLPEFSSWSATLILALSYANSMRRENGTGIHIAVIDIRTMGRDVHVWNVGQLGKTLGEDWRCDVEYLVHGEICGEGYRAVSFENMDGPWLRSFLYETTWRNFDDFGYDLRKHIFSAVVEAQPLTREEMTEVAEIAKLFSPIDCPVAAALVCVHKRPWSGKTAVDPETIQVFRYALGKLNIEPEWDGMYWLAKEGNVCTTNLPEIHQWITLLKALKDAEWGRGARTWKKLQLELTEAFGKLLTQ